MYFVVCLSKRKLFIDSIYVLSPVMFGCCEFVLITLLLGFVVLLSSGFGFGYPSLSVCFYGELGEDSKAILLMSPSSQNPSTW